MNELFHSVSFVSAGASAALLSAIWQGAVLCAGVAICLRLLPGLSAAVRSVVWFNVFVMVLLLHTVPVFTARVPALQGSHVSTIHLDPRWSLTIAGLWLSFSLWRGVQFVLGAIHLRGLARRAVPVVWSTRRSLAASTSRTVDPSTAFAAKDAANSAQDDSLVCAADFAQDDSSILAANFGDRQISVNDGVMALLAGASAGRTAELCTSDEVARPSVLGFLRPRILVPTVLFEKLSAAELQQVVLHEMEHLRRADDWTNLLQKIGLLFFPLNPVLLWIERRLCAERELACDDRVIRSSAGRKAYALCLTHLAEYAILRRSFSLVLGAWERRPELVRRVHRILSQPVRSMGRKPAMAATGGLLAGALGCALALSHSPQLVSFVPRYQPDLQAQSLDPHEVAKALGGTPQLMRAALPAPADQAPAKKPAVRPAVVKRVKHRQTAPNRIARLEAPLPDLDQHALVVLTEWTMYEARPRVALAVPADPAVARPVMIPVKYAIVPTPAGWLIIQI